MNDKSDLEQRISILETQIAVMNGVLLMALRGTKKEKMEAIDIVLRLDDLTIASPSPTLEQVENANTPTSG